MAIAQGRHGRVSIGGVLYPVSQWALEEPRNLNAPIPVGSSYQSNYAEGLQTARFTTNFLLRNNNTTLGTTFWNLWMARTWASGFDDTSPVSIICSDGVKAYTVANAKAEAFTITGAKGAPVGMSGVFVAPAPGTEADSLLSDYTYQVDGSAPLMFDQVTFGGISGNIYGFELNYANNHVINAPLDGTKVAAGWDAGVHLVGASFTFDARRVLEPPFADGATITISIAGTSTRVFTLKSVVSNNPKDRSVGLGQSFMTWRCLVLGTSTVKPLVVT